VQFCRAINRNAWLGLRTVGFTVSTTSNRISQRQSLRVNFQAGNSCVVVEDLDKLLEFETNYPSRNSRKLFSQLINLFAASHWFSLNLADVPYLELLFNWV
jgi:hypothetical protein